MGGQVFLILHVHFCGIDLTGFWEAIFSFQKQFCQSNDIPFGPQDEPALLGQEPLQTLTF